MVMVMDILILKKLRKTKLVISKTPTYKEHTAILKFEEKNRCQSCLCHAHLDPQKNKNFHFLWQFTKKSSSDTSLLIIIWQKVDSEKVCNLKLYLYRNSASSPCLVFCHFQERRQVDLRVDPNCKAVARARRCPPWPGQSD